MAAKNRKPEASVAVNALGSRLVRVSRSIRGADVLTGVVVQSSDEWMLLHGVNDGIFLDGYIGIRLRDVRSVKVYAADSFVARALAHFGDRPKRPRGIDLNSRESLIETAGRRFPLIAIHREKADPTVCFIGTPASVGAKNLRLLEVDPNARWATEPTKWAMKDITRVDFGGRYEAALHAIAGTSPSTNSSGP